MPKYNPARTFTPEGAVGIGGSYMCIYPMESPGGYQLVGQTLPIWNTFGRAGPFNPDKPWLLRIFDQVGWPLDMQKHVKAVCIERLVVRNRTGEAEPTSDVDARCRLLAAWCLLFLLIAGSLISGNEGLLRIGRGPKGEG